VTSTRGAAPERVAGFLPARGSFAFYCVIAWHVALIPTILILLGAHAVFSSAGADVEALQKPAREIAQRSVWITLLVAPLLETGVLALMVTGLARFIRNPNIVAAISAVAWGGLHAAFHPMWFFGVVWSFFVFSRGYLAWRPVSYKHAFGAAAVPHALVNSSALLMQFLSQSQL
jgi:hypothetical protein